MHNKYSKRTLQIMKYMTQLEYIGRVNLPRLQIIYRMDVLYNYKLV